MAPSATIFSFSASTPPAVTATGAAAPGKGALVTAAIASTSPADPSMSPAAVAAVAAAARMAASATITTGADTHAMGEADTPAAVPNDSPLDATLLVSSAGRSFSPAPIPAAAQAIRSRPARTAHNLRAVARASRLLPPPTVA